MLPTPRDAQTPYVVGLVCLGNICRSPMAATVLTDRIEQAGLAARVQVRSAGTGPWHVGDPMDGRALSTLRQAGYDGTRHRGHQVDRNWYDACDLTLAMDTRNHAELVRFDTGDPVRLRMFRSFDPAADSTHPPDVPDPYYDGQDGFASVLRIVERTSDRLVSGLAGLVGAADTP